MMNNILYSLIRRIDKAIKIPNVQAHCDIPCKIYDPSTAQLAALSVVRLLDLISEFESKKTLTIAEQVTLSRLVQEKETHAEKVKHEVRVIWGDYFKQPQFDQFPDISDLVHLIMLTGSACKQTIERSNGISLLELTNEFASAFWVTKSVETYIAECPYPPSLPVVYPKLG